jgi:hypothetical protein
VNWSVVILVAFDVADLHRPHLLKGLANGLEQVPLCSHGVIHKDRSLTPDHLVDCCD